jgi:hypothetical protein
MKVLKKIKNKFKSLFLSHQIYPENKRLQLLFSKYDNIVILGSAPSINQLNLKKIKEDFVITMGNFHEHPDINEINPKIHIFAASHPPITEKVLIDWWTRCNKKLPQSTKLLIEKRDRLIAQKVFNNREIFYYSYGGNLPIDFTRKIFSPWSVTIVALQLAIYCKIKNCFLFGIDHDWQCIKPYTHFYSHAEPSLEFYLKKEAISISYEDQKQPFPKERLYREYELYQQYETLKREAKKNNLKIINADPFSHFDVFDFNKRVDLILNIDRNE